MLLEILKSYLDKSGIFFDPFWRVPKICTWVQFWCRVLLLRNIPIFLSTARLDPRIAVSKTIATFRLTIAGRSGLIVLAWLLTAFRSRQSGSWVRDHWFQQPCFLFKRTDIGSPPFDSHISTLYSVNYISALSLGTRSIHILHIHHLCLFRPFTCFILRERNVHTWVSDISWLYKNQIEYDFVLILLPRRWRSKQVIRLGQVAP